MESNTYFYLELEFWSILIALIALILSQIPPIKLWFKKSKLKVDTYDSIWITHHIGNPIVEFNLIIKNIGGRNILINKIIIDIFRDKKN
jgi:hypothetical protein